MAEIVERTDGIPLFVEEMTKAVLEAGSEGAARRTVAAVPSPALAVPASLHASLMARLDRLGPAKEVAQIGSAIGREFSHALLAAVARKPEAELGSALDRLIQSDLLSGRACLRRLPWCRTRPMARCCASRDAHFTPVSPKPLKAGSPRLPRASRRSSAHSLHRGRADREGRGSMPAGISRPTRCSKSYAILHAYLGLGHVAHTSNSMSYGAASSPITSISTISNSPPTRTIISCSSAGSTAAKASTSRCRSSRRSAAGSS